MHTPHVVIIGGGLAGLSAGCYARASGFRTTIVEHGSALGGVCTSWRRDAYTIDGCIQWLTGGPFERIYTELGILPQVQLRPLDHLLSYRNARDEFSIEFTRDLDRLAHDLCALAPQDASEIGLLVHTARQMVELDPGLAQPRELASLRSSLSSFWSTRRLDRGAMHFHKPLSEYAHDHIESVPLRRILTRLFPEDASALFLALMLGYLERGFLSRPVGGSAAFRDALERTYRELHGDVRLSATVDEILVKDERADGVRLDDGTIIEADYVISTSSMPETLLRLLAGRHGLTQHNQKLEEWKMFGPLLLVSFGVALPLNALPQVLLLDQVAPFQVAGRAAEHLRVRIFNDEPSSAPPGHTVVQTLLSTDFEYWANREQGYLAAKERAAESLLVAIDRQLPGIQAAVTMIDVATPITYWRMARSWRGAYQAFQPNRESLFGHIDKRIDGLGHFLMAGQWVEPGGGVPVAILSGRHAVQLMCAEAKQAFVPGVC